VFRYASQQVRQDVNAKAIPIFKQYVEEKSSGRIKIEDFYDSQLGGVVELIEQTRSGAITFAAPATAFLQAFYKPLGVVDLPYLFVSGDKALSVVDGPIGKRLFAELEAASGLKPLGWFFGGYRNVLNNVRPINTVADLKGIKIRVQANAAHIAAFKALGANPVALDFAQVYNALQTSVVDAFESSLATTLNGKYYEVVKYASLTAHAASFAIPIMNPSHFNKLPADLKQVVLDAGKLHVDAERRFQAEDEASAQAGLEKQGVKVNQVSSAQLDQFAQVARTIYPDFEKDIGKDLLATVLQAVK
jgi:tripartite ATP-independent transporter DctP family solute receptor